MKKKKPNRLFTWLTNKKRAVFLSSLAALTTIALFFPQIYNFFHGQKSLTTITGGVHQTHGGEGSNIVVQGDYYGLTQQQYRDFLLKIRGDLSSERLLSREKEKSRILELELKAVEKKLVDLDSAYEQEKKQRQEAGRSLEKLKEQLPESQIVRGKESLEKGETEYAEKLFDSIIKQGSPAVGLAAYESGRLAERRIDYEKAMERFRVAAALDPDNPKFLGAAGAMAQELGFYSYANKILKHLLEIHKRRDPDGKGVAFALSDLASMYRGMGEYEKAESCHKDSLIKLVNIFGSEHPSVATELNNLAELYRIRGEYDKAEPLFLESISIKEKTLGKLHPSIAVTLGNLAGLYEAKAEYDKAEQLYKQDLSIKEKGEKKDHPSVGTTLNNLAGLYKIMGRLAEAEPLYIQSLAISEKALGPNHPAVAATLNNLGEIYRTRGDYAKAEPLYIRAATIVENTLGRKHPSFGVTRSNLGFLYELRGEHEKAEPLYMEAIAITESALGRNHPSLATMLNNLARLHMSRGDMDKAKPLMERSISIMNTCFPEGHPGIEILENNYKLIIEQKPVKGSVK